MHVIPSHHQSFFNPGKLPHFVERMSELEGRDVRLVTEHGDALNKQVRELAHRIKVFPFELKASSGAARFKKAYSLALRKAVKFVRPQLEYEETLSIAALHSALSAVGAFPKLEKFFDEGEYRKYTESFSKGEAFAWLDKVAGTAASRVCALPKSSVKIVFAGVFHWPSVARELRSRKVEPFVHPPVAHKDYTWTSEFKRNLHRFWQKARPRYYAAAGTEILEHELPEQFKSSPGFVTYLKAATSTLRYPPFYSRRQSAKSLRKEIRRCGLEDYAREKGLWPSVLRGEMA